MVKIKVVICSREQRPHTKDKESGNRIWDLVHLFSVWLSFVIMIQGSPLYYLLIGPSSVSEVI